MEINIILNENIIKLLYRFINNLFYFDNNEKGLRFYILIIMKVKVFQLIYNKIRYLKYARIYKRLI